MLDHRLIHRQSDTPDVTGLPSFQPLENDADLVTLSLFHSFTNFSTLQLFNP